MKKMLVLLLALALLLCACAHKEEKAAMSIRPAELTQAEKDIVKLLGGTTGPGIFDFKLDETVKSMRVSVYKLEDGQWSEKIGGSGYAFDDASGRLALSFDRLSEGIRIAVQGQGSDSFVASQEDANLQAEPMGVSTSYLSDETPIEYETEIPLVVQIATKQNGAVSYQVEYFNNPEEYAKFGYEEVCAVTVTFSREPLQ